jgi:hypothetical protein
MQFIILGWVKPIIIERFKGITAGALRKKRESGFLIEEQHWRRAKDNVIYYNFEEVDRVIGEL